MAKEYVKAYVTSQVVKEMETKQEDTCQIVAAGTPAKKDWQPTPPAGYGSVSWVHWKKSTFYKTSERQG